MAKAKTTKSKTNKSSKTAPVKSKSSTSKNRSTKGKAQPAEVKKQDVLPGVPGIALNAETKILRAPLIKNENAKNSQLYHVASITDIPASGYLDMPKKEIRVKQSLPKAEKYELEPFDVLLTIVGTIGEITILPEKLPGKWIPSSNMLIIRFNDSKQDKAIAFYMFMKSKHGQSILKNLTHGATIPIISKKAFSKKLIPELTTDIKRESKKFFNNESKIFQKIEDLKKSAEELRATYLA